MLNYNGTTFTNFERQGYHDNDYAYTVDKGFMFAFGVYDEGGEGGADAAGRPMEEYLNIRISAFELREDNPDERDSSFEILEYHPCTQEELANFNPHSKVSE